MVHVYKVKDGHGVIMQSQPRLMFLSNAVACLMILAFLLCVLYSLTVTPYRITTEFPHKREQGFFFYDYMFSRRRERVQACSVLNIHAIYSARLSRARADTCAHNQTNEIMRNTESSR